MHYQKNHMKPLKHVTTAPPVKQGKINCLECKDRAKCKTLCKKAERYVGQDNVKLSEKLIGKPIEYSDDWPEGRPEQDPKKFTDREMVVGALMVNKIPHRLIRKALKLKSNTYWNLVHKLKKKMFSNHSS